MVEIFTTDFTQGGGRISGSRQDSNDISTATSIFGVNELNGAIVDTPRCSRKWEIQDGSLQTGYTYISTSRQDRNEIPTGLTLHFRGPATQWDWLEYCATKPEVENPI